MVGLLDVTQILSFKVDVEIPTLDSTYFIIEGQVLARALKQWRVYLAETPGIDTS